jgi:predicted HicB family RNase H-like nuclease
MKPMKYKGYSAKIEYDDECNIFRGEIIGINDFITFHGDSVDELKQSFKDSIDVYLEYCEEQGEQPDKPYTGKFSVRISPDLHRKAALAANIQGTSLNKLVEDALGKAITT